MCVYMCKYMYVHIHTYTYIYICVCICESYIYCVLQKPLVLDTTHSSPVTCTLICDSTFEQA